MNQEAKPYLAKVETPRAAAIAGLVFSFLLLITFVLVHYYVPENPLAPGSWLANSRKTVSFALNLLPFAGVAFLWFIGVVRDHLGENEDRLFSTVFPGSGLLFLATLFVSAGIAGSVLRFYETGSDALFESGIYLFGRTTVF